VLGAAAAIAVFAIGGAIAANDLPGSSSSSTDTAAGSSSADQESAGARPTPGGAAAQRQQGAGGSGSDQNDAPLLRGSQAYAAATAPVPDLSTNSVRDFAQELAAGSRLARRPPVECRIPYPAGTSSATGKASPVDALVAFEGMRALLQLDRADRTVTVVACPGPYRILYRSTY